MSLTAQAMWVLELLERGSYEAPSGRTVAVDGRACVEATRVITPEDVDRMLADEGSGGDPPVLDVIDATTAEAAAALAKDGRVALLNFASARNPGGGFLSDARAQEEELCRCSALFPALVTAEAYYTANRANRSALYTDHAIWTPEVPFFRLSTQAPLLEEPFLADVITAPAPNAGALRADELTQVPPTFSRRWALVLAIARAQGARTLVLGAWGCGAFRNDPEVAAGTLATVLVEPRWRGAFDRIVVAIPSMGRQSTHNLAVFRRVLSGSAA